MAIWKFLFDVFGEKRALGASCFPITYDSSKGGLELLISIRMSPIWSLYDDRVHMKCLMKKKKKTKALDP